MGECEKLHEHDGFYMDGGLWLKWPYMGSSSEGIVSCDHHRCEICIITVIFQLFIKVLKETLNRYIY